MFRDPSTPQPRSMSVHAFRSSVLLLIMGSIAIPCLAQSTGTTTPASGGSAPALGQTPGNGAASSSTFFESQMLSYSALGPLADQIAREVCDALPSGAHLVLFDTTSFLTVQQYRSFAKEVALLTELFNSFVPVADKAQAAVGGPSLQVAEGIFQTLSGVIGASTADKNSTFPLSDIAIAMSLSKKLKSCANSKSFDVTYPRIAIAESPGAFQATDNAVTQSVVKLFQVQRAAARAAQNEENTIKDRDLRTGTAGAFGGTSTGSAQSAVLNTAFGSPLSVTVKDAAGNPLGGQSVTFVAPASGASGTFPGGGNSVTVLTNGSGVASTTITANGSAGSYTVTATVAGLAHSNAGFALTNLASQPASISVASPPAAPASPGGPTLPAAPPRSVMGSDYLALTGATGLVNQFLSSYGLPASGTGVAPIAPVLQGAQLMSLLNTTSGQSYIVFWEGSAAGGTQRDRKNLLTNVFTGDWISYSGGAVLSFGMINVQSGLLFSPTLHRFMTPYTTFTDPPADQLKSVRRASDLELPKTP